MKGLTSNSCILFLAACLCLGQAQGANFTALLDRDTIAMGDIATLSLVLEGDSLQNMPDLQIPGLIINAPATNDTFSIVKGITTSTSTLVYEITPQHTGQFTIPAFSAQVGGQTLTTRPLTLNVLKAGVPYPGSSATYMTLCLPPGKVYVGQKLMAQLQIYIRDDVENFTNFQLPAREMDGFILGTNAQIGRYQTQVGGRNYTAFGITNTLTTTRIGRLTLGPFTAVAMITVPSQNQQGGDPLFRKFFNQGEQKPISLSSDSASVDSLPLPEQNKPANFGGAIGDFTMAVDVVPTNVTLGDPIIVQLKIAGHGTLDAITLPRQSIPGFKIFFPTSKTESSDALGLGGTKTLKEIVIPQNTDIHEWPQFSLSYFNPEDGQYHTLTQPAVPLTVHHAVEPSP
jgi:BatD DUF11 like domain